MRGIGVFVSILFFLASVGLFIYGFKLTGMIVEKAEAQNMERGIDYEWTTAICKENKCQDFKITCKDGEVVEMIPLTDEVFFSENWEDERENRKDLCKR